MGRLGLAAAVAALGLASGASAEPLERVESEVYQAEGAVPALTRKAAVCIGRIVKPGVVNAPTIVTQDIEGGVVVANSAFRYMEKSMGMRFGYRGRAKVTFEARPGRFRIVHTEIERLSELNPQRGWEPVYPTKKPQAQYADAMMQAIADEVAECVKAEAEAW